MSSIERGRGFGSVLVRLLGVVIALIGLTLTIGGGQLIMLGGSPYYLIVGLLMILSGFVVLLLAVVTSLAPSIRLLGADGHTAGIFNREQLEQAAGRCAIMVPRPDGLDGITATPMVLSWFNRIVVLATGAAKRPRITEWFTGSADVIANMATSSCPLVEIWADPDAAPTP